MSYPLEKQHWHYVSCHIYRAHEPDERAILIRPLRPGMRDWFIVGNNDVKHDAEPTATLDDLLRIDGIYDPHATHNPHKGSVTGYVRVKARKASRGHAVIMIFDWSVYDFVTSCVSIEDIREEQESLP